MHVRRVNRDVLHLYVCGLRKKSVLVQNDIYIGS